MIRRFAAALVSFAVTAGTLGAVVTLPVVPFQGIFQAVAGERWVDRAAQAQAESGFNPRAVSMVTGKDGIRRPCAYGLTQFTPPTWEIWGKGGDPYNPAASIPAQHAYMNWLEARCGGELDPALGSYNAGLGSIRKAQALADRLGLVGSNPWLQTLAKVTGPANQAQTVGYILHNRQARASIHRKLGAHA